MVDVDWENRSDLPAQPITYRAVIVPEENQIDMSRSVPLLAGFVPPDPARAAEAEQTRWKARENRALHALVAPVPLDTGCQNGRVDRP